MTQGKCAELDAKILELVRNGADTFNALVVRDAGRWEAV